jgi:hypothetical protein
VAEPNLRNLAHIGIMNTRTQGGCGLWRVFPEKRQLFQGPLTKNSDVAMLPCDRPEARRSLATLARDYECFRRANPVRRNSSEAIGGARSDDACRGARLAKGLRLHLISSQRQIQRVDIANNLCAFPHREKQIAFGCMPHPAG